MARRASIFGLVKETVLAFIADDALSRGASIAFYVVTSMVPVLVIVISIAGAVFGRDAARGAIAAQLSDVMGRRAPTCCNRRFMARRINRPASSPARSVSLRF